MGLEKGWGDTAERVLEMIHLLLGIRARPVYTRNISRENPKGV
jgi:hypothetical protein